MLPLRSMHLTIDIGNTFTKSLVFDGAIPVGEIAVGPSESAYIQSLLIAHKDKRIVLSSVVALDDAVGALLKHQHVLVVNGHTPTPLQSRYTTPLTLGIDRICAAVASKARFPNNAVLAIDMGSCITYDVVSADGVHLGGSISPGLNMRFRALSEFTSKLPLVSAQQSDQTIGTDTQSAIRNGVQQGILLEVNGIISQQSSIHNGLCTIATGGDLSFFANDLKTPIFADPILVLRGLHEILLFNR